MQILFPLSLSILLLFVSCANNEKTVTREKVSHGDPLLDKYASNHGYSKTGGMIRSNSDEKSEFSGKQFYGSNDFSGKNYTTEKYASKRWGGNSKYENKKYAGNIDGSKYQYSPDFAQQQAKQGSMVANAQGQSFDANSVDKYNSRENAGRRLSMKESDYGKRDNISDAVILPWKDQQKLQSKKGGLSELSVNDAKIIMGRADENEGF